MTETKREPSRDLYEGSLTLPGEEEPRRMSLSFDQTRLSVTLRFEPPVVGTNEWTGSSVSIVQRPKYREVWFHTVGVPRGKADLSWKCNASLADDTLAGVIVARPNEDNVSGEKGFILVRPT